MLNGLGPDLDGLDLSYLRGRVLAYQELSILQCS
jgi:hypothetical protein